MKRWFSKLKAKSILPGSCDSLVPVWPLSERNLNWGWALQIQAGGKTQWEGWNKGPTNANSQVFPGRPLTALFGFRITIIYNESRHHNTWMMARPGFHSWHLTPWKNFKCSLSKGHIKSVHRLNITSDMFSCLHTIIFLVYINCKL